VESFAVSLEDEDDLNSPAKKMPRYGIVAKAFKSTTIKL